MDLQGKIIAALPERGGESARSGQPWKAQSFVVETHDSYPRRMVFDVFGEDRLKRFNIKVGQEVTVSFDIDAHEYNGRWFNNIRAYDVRLVDPASVPATGGQTAGQGGVISDGGNSAAANGGGVFPPPQPAAEGSSDDLPF